MGKIKTKAAASRRARLLNDYKYGRKQKNVELGSAEVVVSNKETSYHDETKEVKNTSCEKENTEPFPKNNQQKDDNETDSKILEVSHNGCWYRSELRWKGVMTPKRNKLTFAKTTSTNFEQVEDGSVQNKDIIFDESANDEELIITTEAEQQTKEKYVGRRMVNVSYLVHKVLGFCDHGPFGCSASDIVLVGEKQNGLLSKFTFQCKMCNVKFYVDSDNNEDNYLNLNACAVAGTIAIGAGHSQQEELLSAMDLPTISDTIYKQNHDLIFENWVNVQEKNMEEAGKKEKEIAIATGRVTEDGLGIVDVIVDGCWCKRSYKKNYSALSGAATIIGKNTGEILYLGVKNKYCSVCANAEKQNIEKKEHACYKNYEGSSTAMESQILVEGFKNSIEQHGLVYGRLISDGDSSTYSKILAARPYKNITVEKVECRNHLLRNLCNKLYALTTDTKYPNKFRKLITKNSIKYTRGAITKSICKHKTNSDVHLLFEDIMLSHHHGFGEHHRCKKYFCNNAGEVNNNNAISRDFFTSVLWKRICTIIEGVAAHARSLIHDVDSNKVEGFHSVVAKFVGGKRVNFAKKNSYELRVNAAAVAFTNKKAISRLYKNMNGGKSPRGKIKKLEERRLKKANYNKMKRKPKRRVFNQAGSNKDYGDGSIQPDKDEEIFERLKKNFMERLKYTDEQREAIQRNTILQSESGEWLELRRSLLTASNFGKVINRRSDTSCANTVKNMLYKSNIDHVLSVSHGKEKEKIAIKQLSLQLNMNIQPCGLFIDRQLQFLGATPDGVCNDGQYQNSIVEIKCPITAHTIGIEEAIKLKKVTFWKADGTINTKHNWYYQVQGQLRITERNKCIFGAWANEKEPLKVEIIQRDDQFWRNQMQNKLTNFYMDCILPELVDPRHPRHLPIRDPKYIEEAIEKKKKKNKV